jgi:ATP-dependent exoDNAse (exonuclease V) beta subunit
VLGRDPELAPADDLIWQACSEASWLRLRALALAEQPETYADCVEAYGEFSVKRRIIALANQAATTAGGMIAAADGNAVSQLLALRREQIRDIESALAEATAADGKFAAIAARAPSEPTALAEWCAQIDACAARANATKAQVRRMQDALDFPCLRDEDGGRVKPDRRYGCATLAALSRWTPRIEASCRARAQTIATLAMRFNQLQRDEVERRGHAGFARIEAEALALMRDARVRRELGRRFRHVLLDESQDFNRLQAAFVEGLREEGARIFAVGDHRQSIYGFRHAAPELFEAWQQRDLSAVARLTDNFRSHPHLVDGVKSIFAQPSLTAAFAPEHIRPGREGASFARAARLQLTSVESADVSAPIKCGSIAGSEHQALFIATTIAESLAQGRGPSDHAILLRSRSRMRIYAAALEQLGIAYDADFPGGLYDSQECHDLEALLRLSVCAHDRFALAVAFGGPWGSEDPHDKRLLVEILSGDGDPARALNGTELGRIIPQIRARCAGEGVASAIRWLAAQPRLCARYGRLPLARRRLANLALLAEEEQEAGGALDVIAFITRLGHRRQLGVDAREASGESLGDRGVRLMTIHGAKGLEWPVVFVPDCDSQFRTSDLSSIALSLPVDDGGEAIRVACKPGSAEEGDSIARLLLRQNLQERLLAEEARLLYVACTRACEELHLVIAGEGRSPADLPRCYADWLLGSELPWTMVDVDLARAARAAPAQATEAETLPSLRLEIAGTSPDLRTVTELCGQFHADELGNVSGLASERAKTLGTALHEALCRFGPGMSAHQARDTLAPFAGELPSERSARLEASLRRSDLVPGYWQAAVRLSEQAVIAETEIDGATKVVSGICDLLIQDADGAWHLYDYKSGVATKNPASRMQIRCYARMLRAVLERPLRSAWLIDLESAEREEVSLADAEVDQAWKSALAAWSERRENATGSVHAS